MCGIAGIIKSGLLQSDLQRLSSKMANTLVHRGPDYMRWLFLDEKYGLCMSHRRLAIIDTSVAGQQPMVSNCGRFVIVFNGEIYNFRDLKKTLEATGVMFKSNSDTEVFIEYISAFGVVSACQSNQWDVCICHLGQAR